VPLLFRRELYASVSIATGVLYAGGLAVGLDPFPVTLAALVAGFAFRAIAVLRNWNIPQFAYTTERADERER
jgi:uncharacterized membrane protein YeiH